jgi:hypothetical protein
MPYRSPDQRAVTPQNRGRFPGYDVLDEVERWDDVTTGVVLARLAPITDLSFFTMAENAAASALCDLLLHQDSEPRIPVVALIDRRLAVGETDGWHYDDMPEDGQAWRDTLRYLDEDATGLHADAFCKIEPSLRAAIVQHVQDLGSDPWHGLPAAQVWSLWTRYACAEFYAHPWAWNEIGFGGPAYPRGYKNRGETGGRGGRERWEVADHDDTDPVPFAARVERARRAHAELVERPRRDS